MIIVRRNFSDVETPTNKYAETEKQAKKRETDAAKGVLATGGLGAALAARHTLRKGGAKLEKKVEGAAIGGVISAGLYGLSRKNLIKQNEEKNRRLAMRRERLAAKQKED